MVYLKEVDISSVTQCFATTFHAQLSVLYHIKELTIHIYLNQAHSNLAMLTATWFPLRPGSNIFKANISNLASTHTFSWRHTSSALRRTNC